MNREDDRIGAAQASLLAVLGIALAISAAFGVYQAIKGLLS